LRGGGVCEFFFSPGPNGFGRGIRGVGRRAGNPGAAEGGYVAFQKSPFVPPRGGGGRSLREFFSGVVVGFRSGEIFFSGPDGGPGGGGEGLSGKPAGREGVFLEAPVGVCGRRLMRPGEGPRGGAGWGRFNDGSWGAFRGRAGGGRGGGKQGRKGFFRGGGGAEKTAAGTWFFFGEGMTLSGPGRGAGERGRVPGLCILVLVEVFLGAGGNVFFSPFSGPSWGGGPGRLF